MLRWLVTRVLLVGFFAIFIVIVLRWSDFRIFADIVHDDRLHGSSGYKIL
jgi:hypothetical protein